MIAIVINDPVDYYNYRIPIEGYEKGTEHKVKAIAKNGEIYLKGCIHPFHVNDLIFK